MASRALLPGLTLNQEVPFRYRTQPMRARVSGGLRTGVAFAFDPRQLRGNAKEKQHFPYFPFALWGRSRALSFHRLSEAKVRFGSLMAPRQQ